MRGLTGRLEGEAIIAIEDSVKVKGERACEVRVPASTSNLGAGFDCFGLALKLYLTVRARVVPEARYEWRMRSSAGEQETEKPATNDDLIFRAMRYAAEREGLSLPPVRLAVHNAVPIGRGLGSSGAAIVAGISLCSALCETEISHETALRYAFELEGHADNVAAALYGGLVISCVKADGHVLTIKRRWPPSVKVIVVSPDVPLQTVKARSALPLTVSRDDAVHNLQRAALFGAAIEEGAYELLWEAMRDRLHQVHRQSLVKGLADALATPQRPGLIGLALSGSGPSIVALASDNFDEIGEAIATNFRLQEVEATVRLLEVDNEGIRIEGWNRRDRM